MIVHDIAYQLAVITLDTDGSIPETNLENSQVQLALQIFFGIAAAVAVLIIAIAALKYTLSRGDESVIKKSKETIIYAVAGLLITITAFSIVTLVVNRL